MHGSGGTSKRVRDPQCSQTHIRAMENLIVVVLVRSLISSTHEWLTTS